MRYTLRHVEVFLAVAKEESISRAAEALSLSQSATSAAMQEFESRYGMQLFDRNAKRLHLNSFGHTIRAKAQGFMIHAQDFDRELKKQEESGHLKVGASYIIGNYLAFKYLAAYMQQHPSAEVKMAVSNTPDILAQVLNFEVDVGLIEAELHHEDLHLQLWREDKMCAFCSPNHTHANKQGLSDKDILSSDWIVREANSGHRQTFNRAMQGLLPSLNIALELSHNEAIKNAVKAGLGLGFLSEIAVADEIAQGALVPLPLEGRSVHRNFYIVTHKQSPEKQAVRRWIALCKGA